jgi:hypothetical protein
MWLSKEECIRIFGSERALQFMETFGGSTLYVPQHPRAKHKIAECVGIIGMATLCKEYSRCYVEVANGGNTPSKKAAIIDFLAKGDSFRQTAQKAGSSVRYVTMVARDSKELIARKSLELGHSRKPRADAPERPSASGIIYAKSA